MKVSNVSCTLVSSDKYNKWHTFDVVSGNKELLLCREGKVFARITVQTQEKDVRDEDGDWHSKPTDDFYLIFEPEASLDKNIAIVSK